MIRPGKRSGYELYDLLADRSESKDVASEHRGVVKEMSAALETWQASCAKSAAGTDYK